MFPSKKHCLPFEFAFVMKRGRWYWLFSFIFFVILLPLLSCQSDSICTFTCLPSRVAHFSLISAAATLNARSDSLQDGQCHDTTNPALFWFCFPRFSFASCVQFLAAPLPVTALFSLFSSARSAHHPTAICLSAMYLSDTSTCQNSNLHMPKLQIKLVKSSQSSKSAPRTKPEH